jgi:hypothetical protein
MDALLYGFKALLGGPNVIVYHHRSNLYSTPECLLEKD